MGLLSPSPSVMGEASPSTFSEAVESSPLSIRVTSCRKTPLFPNAASLLGPREEGKDGISNEKRHCKFDSLAKMIDAHVEELKKRPLRGISEDYTRKHCYGDSAPQGEMMDIDDVTMGIQR